MTVSAAGSAWTVSYLGDHVLFDVQADATTADTAIAAAVGTSAFASTLALYAAFSSGGNWGHIKTLTPVTPPAAVLADIDGGAAT